MLGRISDWLDHRTGYRKFMEAMLLEHIPGGAKWRYVWGSCLAFVFSIQLITGVLLMTAYSPGDTNAWGSVFFIQYEMDFGWLIRGLHHFGSQTMVVLLAIHMLQVVIAGAHLAPREINWWLGLALMGIVLGLSLTGYLLPWDQKGYYATRVATNIAGSLPVIGEFVNRILLGGPDFGNHTLTRFYTLHVGVLPPLLIVLLVAHIAVFRRHGVTTPPNAKGEDYFWPAQAFRDLIVCLIIFGIMMSLVVFGGHGNKIEPPAGAAEPGLYETWAKAGRDGLGANLDAPADRQTAGYPARPEWYFLFLFQILKYFEGDLILVGTVIIPNGAMVLLFLLPFLGYGRMRKFGHVVGVLVVVALLGSVAVLTALALADDSPEPWPMGLGGGTPEAKGFHHRTVDAEKLAKRAVQLADAGIPVEGATQLLRNDPLTRGSELFKVKCAACHSINAPNLQDFGSATWIKGLLDNPKAYFGKTKLTGMIGWRKEIDNERKEMDEKAKAQQDADLELVARWLAKRDPLNAADASRAKVLFTDEEKGFGCIRCHKFEGKGTKRGPDLTGYGSQDWIRLMVMNPGHETRYGGKNEMPAFRAKEGPGAEILLNEFADLQKKHELNTQIMELSDIERELIIRYITHDYRVVFGGRPVSGPPLKRPSDKAE